MSLLKSALELASQGFHIFPLVPGSKLPLIDDFPNRATRDPNQIKNWWTDPVMGFERDYNIGISTTKFGDDGSLVVIDVDNKEGKNGSKEIEKYEVPKTFTQKTPTGGYHLVFRCPQPVRQGVDKLGTGLDIRGKGGYIAGAGSIIEGHHYAIVCRDLPAAAPQWLLDICGKTKKKTESKKVEGINEESALSRARDYLLHHAPAAVAGSGGDQTTYQVACRVKDFGVDQITATTLMQDDWNPRCEPPWDNEEIRVKVENAYRYGVEPIGVNAPESQFTPIIEDEKLHPFEEMNKEFSFLASGAVLWETLDYKGNFKLEHLSVQAFHQYNAPKTITFGDKTYPVSQLWLKSQVRRTYDGIVFMPGRECPKRFYNLWRGFAVEPKATGSKEAHNALAAFIEHALKNICDNDQNLFNWLMGYFAHMVQKPWEKPYTSLVFKGKKGVGKNALIKFVGHLLGNHYRLAADRRYLVGNFNSHLENLVMFVLDEAFWSGDKSAEGILKDLITGEELNIERKGMESYTVPNCIRVVIIGNEDWVVPASEDERRFAVFNVGEGRKRDVPFFSQMRKGMEAGGYELLLNYLLNFKMSEVNEAPMTIGLAEQKTQSLDPFLQFWVACLTEGRIVGSDFGSEWPTVVEKDLIRTAYRKYVHERNINSRLYDSVMVGKLFKKCLPSIDASGKRRESDRSLTNVYKFPTLEVSRQEWNKYIGFEMKWD